MNSFQRPTFRLCLSIFIAFLFKTSIGLSAEVLNVKGTKALIDISDRLDLKVGQNLDTLNSQGRRTSVLKIRQIKSGKAVADILKGRVLVGQKIVPTKNNAEKKQALKILSTQSSWGTLLGFNSNILKFNSTASGDLKLTGSSNSLKGFFQEDLSQLLSIRIGVGMESFTAKGTSSQADISSFAFDVMIRASLLRANSFKPWLGAGLGFLIPVSKSASFMDESKISARQHFQFGGGTDINIDKRRFIPLEVTYSISPKSAQFSTEQMSVRLGYGQKF